MLEIINIEIERAGQSVEDPREELGEVSPGRHLCSWGGEADHLPGGGDQVDHVADQHNQDNVQGDTGEGCLSPSLIYL